MAMPAIQALRDEYVDAHITVLTKAHLGDLWRLHTVADSIIEFGPGHAGTLEAVSRVRQGAFDVAYVMPNSFRSALIPFMGGVPKRTGLSGHSRAFMLNDVVRRADALADQHQAWEYLAIVNLSPNDATELRPHLKIEDSARESIQHLGVDFEAPVRIAVMPGAAYGDAKRWPVESFCEVAEALVEKTHGQILLLGTRNEAEACASIVTRLPNNALSLAGRTTIPELAAALDSCALAIANDSGGMHLAAGVRTPVVGIYGITDPAKTGPMGQGHQIVLKDGVVRSRDLQRSSERALAALAAITPEQVVTAALSILNGQSR
ncbi:MAG: heptosyltransferase-2 [Candidatus Promineifilaceae bacterium]|jgi:heptosyltransferase II